MTSPHRRRLIVVLATLAGLAANAAAAEAAPTSEELRFTTSDGVPLQATLTGEAPLSARPTIVEFSPYGPGSGTVRPGPEYNFLLVQIRGTGGSGGRFDALGPRTQADVVEVLEWACGQPWTNGKLGLNGFSASAITVYNSLHQDLPCVKTAVLKSGTFELYRDLIWPGGISNLVPGAGVMVAIGAPALAQSPSHVDDPVSGLEVAAGLLAAGLEGLMRPTLDSWWRERGFRGDVNDLPILMIDGFFDVESRGAFQAFRKLRRDGAHLLVVGAHDGAPAGTDGGVAETDAWFDRYLRGVDNGVEDHPRVELWLADGDREDHLAGDFVHVEGERWPIGGTHWGPLWLRARRSGTANSINDGALVRRASPQATTQSYPALPSPPNGTDPHNTAIAGPAAPNSLADAFPALTEMGLAESVGLTYTTKPFAEDVLTAGPASLELRLSGTVAETGIWAVISDVAADGGAHPVASGRLLSAYPKINRRKSLIERRTGNVVQPYGVYSEKSPAAPGAEHLYRVELWPIGNRFKAGHRLRLHLVGTSAVSMPGAPAVNTVTVGGEHGSRLLLPVLPGSDLRQALRGGGKRAGGGR